MDVDPRRGILIDLLLNAHKPGLSKQDKQTPCPYREELEQKSIDELLKLYEPVRQSIEHQEAEGRLVAAKLKFAKLATSWARKPYWGKHEAVALLVKSDPLDCISHGRTGEYLSVPSLVEELANELDDLISRAITTEVFPKRLPPAALLYWLTEKGVVVPSELMNAVGPLVASVVAPAPVLLPHLVDDDSESEADSLKKGAAIKRRIQEILLVIEAKGWDSMSIADGGKAEIERICLTRPALFTASTFPKAWQVAVNEKLVRMENH